MVIMVQVVNVISTMATFFGVELFAVKMSTPSGRNFLCQRLVYFGCDPGSEDLDGFHQRFVRGSADIHVGGEARKTEHLIHLQDLLDSLVYIANDIGAFRSAAIVILLSAEGRPPAGAADARHLRGINRIVRIRGLLAVLPEKAVHVDTDLKLAHVVTELFV